MAEFKYKALDRSGKSQEGVIDKKTVAEVADWLGREGWVPLSIQPAAGRSRGRPGASRTPRRRRRMNERDRVLHFTRELSVMLGSGLPLDRSLAILEELADDAGKALVGDIRAAVRKGSTLADAFAERREFSPFYISMIRAGEASGSLEVSLRRMAEYLERAKAMRQLVMSALTYPAILFGVAVLSLVFLLAYVVPSFSDLFSDMGGQLPAPTRFVMNLGDFMAHWWWLVLLLFGALYWLAGRLWRDEAIRRRLDARSLGWPIIGELVRNVDTSRFARTLGVLLQGGVSLVNALAIGREVIGNRLLRDDLDEATVVLREGRSLSGALLDSGRFPMLAMHMIQVGEETGRLEEMLLKVADIYEDEVGTVIKRLLALLEPVLILSLGVMIAGIIISILLGILGVNDLVG